MRPLLILAPALALAACNAADKAGDATANATETAGNAAVAVGGSIANAVAEGAADLKREVSGKPVAHDGWVGRWKGVEGTYLVVAKGKDAGAYKLEMQYTLDVKGSFEGRGTRDGIAFERPDGKQEMRASDGDATSVLVATISEHLA